MWIKICGNTSLADAQHAANSGASAVGFVFAPSPRRVTVDQVRAISPHLPRNVERIGVFVDATFDELVSAVREADLTGVQLHANDDPDLPRRLRAHFAAETSTAAISILAVLAFSDDMEPQIQGVARDAARDGAIDALLIDSRSPVGHGGTGTCYDWQAAQHLFRKVAPQLRLIAAGGLHPDNVAEAIRTLTPWGVDVATGVEAAPGRKDPARVAAFIRNARDTFAQLKKPPRPRAARR
ncbi:MAG TPA: phosphoribosylanthranilate isomerase [Acidobacteriaceae bacterium]|nr:phosphoribosylanthranilate isomerase [Acidobacteriaceae bacterium]